MISLPIFRFLSIINMVINVVFQQEEVTSTDGPTFHTTCSITSPLLRCIDLWSIYYQSSPSTTPLVILKFYTGAIIRAGKAHSIAK